MTIWNNAFIKTSHKQQSTILIQICLQQQKLPRKYKSIKCPEVNRSNLTSAQVPKEKQQQMKFDKPCQHHKAPSSMQISSSFLSVSSNIYCAICVYVPADTPTFNPVEDLLTQAKYLLKRHKEWKRHEEEEREWEKKSGIYGINLCSHIKVLLFIMLMLC